MPKPESQLDTFDRTRAPPRDGLGHLARSITPLGSTVYAVFPAKMHTLRGGHLLSARQTSVSSDRGRAHPSHVRCASGARVHPTTDVAHASNARVLGAVPGVRARLAGCDARVAQWPHAVHAQRVQLDAGSGLCLPREPVALW